MDLGVSHTNEGLDRSNNKDETSIGTIEYQYDNSLGSERDVPVMLEVLPTDQNEDDDGYLSDPVETDERENAIVFSTPGGISKISHYSGKKRDGHSINTNTPSAGALQNQLYTSKANEDLQYLRYKDIEM